MTLEERMIQELVERGLFDDQAQAILEIYKGDLGEVMAGRWNDSVEWYSKNMVKGLWVGVKIVAREWIAENLPRALFAPLFD